MGVRRALATGGYEEMDGENVPNTSATPNPGPGPPTEFELASVSVVPDGKF